MLNYTTLGFPLIRGFTSHERYETHPWMMTASQVYACEKFHFQKSECKVYSFRVPIYKGVPLPWIKWNPFLNDDCWPTIQVWKDSLSEKWVLKYATLGFPLIRGFPSHEWNDTSPLTMAACQVYAREKFYSFNDDSWSSVQRLKSDLLKRECKSIQLQGSRL